MVSRGKDVAGGPRLKIDLTTGMYRFELEPEAAGAAAPCNQVRRLPSRLPSPRNRSSPTGRGVRPASSACCSTRRTRKRKAKGAIKKICADAPATRRRRLATEHQRQPGTAERLTPCGCSRSWKGAQGDPAGRAGRRRPANGSANGHAARSDEPDAAHGRQGWLTVANVQKSYRSRMVVKGVSLATGRGEAVGLLGPNGAGKTTVFYMVTGLVPADAGRVTLDGRDVTRLPMYRRARLGIGYLPQEASIFRGLTVEQNIMAVLELVEPNRKRRKEQLDNLLEEFNITRLRKSPSLALSGGERRRCEIARALATRPSFMLLDEPFAGIDPLAVGDIQQLVRQLTARGIGVLITDHNVRETLSLVDRAYIIYDGQVLTHGKPQEIIANRRRPAGLPGGYVQLMRRPYTLTP